MDIDFKCLYAIFIFVRIMKCFYCVFSNIILSQDYSSGIIMLMSHACFNCLY